MAPAPKRCPTCGQLLPKLHRLRCEECDRRFQARRSDARYCSDRCRVAAHRAKKKTHRRKR